MTPKADPKTPGKSVFQMEENVFLTTVRGEPKTFGGRFEQVPLLGFTATVVKLLAVPLSPVQLSVIVTVCALAGIVTDTEPVAAGEVPFQPLKAGLLVRVQFKLLPKPDAVQLIEVFTLTLTDVGLALINTDGPAPGVLTLAMPLTGSIATAASFALVVSGVD